MTVISFNNFLTLAAYHRPSLSDGFWIEMFGIINDIVRDESGATAIEYGLIVALLSVAVIWALTAYGQSVTNVFGSLSTTFDMFSEQQATL